MPLCKQPCVVAQALPLGGRVQEVRDRPGESGGIEEVDEASGLVVLDGFAQGWGVARHDGAAGAHGLEQAPAEHEGIGQVDVHA